MVISAVGTSAGAGACAGAGGGAGPGAYGGGSGVGRGGSSFDSALGSGSFTWSPASSIACVHTSSCLPLMVSFVHENRELSNWVVPGSASAARPGSSGVVESAAASRAAAQAGALGRGRRMPGLGGRRILGRPGTETCKNTPLRGVSGQKHRPGSELSQEAEPSTCPRQPPTCT